ncbi:IQ domain-containing protein C [Dromiciops gliroides]|uniref:IQ domain-containing protein C n=1 Tax=Dromiciops gliroides TaxID=33562 RepID=UPI001CC767A8|nr:IQ domain-containing protein C [Dromiciops gliroides]
MELQELVRRVTMLQACVRGRQTRRRLRSLRAEYEEVVRQVEGELGGQLRWVGRWLPRPVFSPETPRKRTLGLGAGGDSGPGPAQERPSRLRGEEPERDGGWREGKGSEQGAGPGPQHGLLMEAGDTALTRNPEALELTLPSQPAHLQRLRRHLAMEMLWLQQAIVSRKKYLLLRQTLDLPED